MTVQRLRNICVFELLKLNISEALYGHTKPLCKLNTKTLYKIGGRGTKSCPLCLTEKLPDGNYVNHIE